MAGRKFSVDISKWVKKANGNVHTATSKMLLNITKNVTYETPVKDGYARNNWRHSLNEPDLTTTDVPDKKPKVESKMVEIPEGQDFNYYLTNSLPYIEALEYGSSRQAPQGMVRMTVADFTKIAVEAVEFTKRGGRE